MEVVQTVRQGWAQSIGRYIPRDAEVVQKENFRHRLDGFRIGPINVRFAARVHLYETREPRMFLRQRPKIGPVVAVRIPRMHFL
jgi:hypothetical protein